MEFSIGEMAGAVEVVESSEAVSTHTGRTTEVLHVRVRVGEGARAAIDAAAKGEQRAIAADTGKQYKVRMLSSTNVNRSDTWTYELELTECEDVAAHSINIDGIELRPYRFEEKSDGGAIISRAWVQAGGGEVDALEALICREPRPYFPVVRRGLQSEARQMRFGRCLYSDHPTGRKYQLVLVEQPYDDVERPRLDLFEPEQTRIRDSIVGLQEAIRALTEALVEGGSVSDENADRVRSVLGAPPSLEQLRQFDRCRDVDLL